MKTIKLNGFVIRGHSFGESHKIITLFSEELGKIKLIAHGVRKTNSKYGSTFELLNEVSLVVSSSKSDDLYNIKDFNLLISSHNIRCDFKQINLLYHLADFLNAFISEDCNDKLVYKLLKDTLLQCSQNKTSCYELIKSFEIKSLKVLGYLPNLKYCSQCQNSLEKNRIFISQHDGWIFCLKCSKQNKDYEINFGTYKFLLSLEEFEIPIIARLKINGIFQKETDLSIEKLIISILGKKLNSFNWLNV